MTREAGGGNQTESHCLALMWKRHRFFGNDDDEADVTQCWSQQTVTNNRIQIKD